MYCEYGNRRVMIDAVNNGIVLAEFRFGFWHAVMPPRSFVATYGDRNAMKAWLENWLSGGEQC